jgi:hypothetical protein
MADGDLVDCRAPDVSPDWRFTIAYHAALHAATAALAAAGFRASREGQHYRMLQSLTLTIGADPQVVAQLDGFRAKRNISSYERRGAVSVQEVQEMVGLARWFRQRVGEWLRAEHPELL